MDNKLIFILVVLIIFVNNTLWYLCVNRIEIRRFIRNKIEWFKRLSFKKKALLTTLVYLGFSTLLYFPLRAFWLNKLEFSTYLSVIVALIAFIQIYKSSQRELYGLLHIRSKERIKILSEFSPKKDLIGNKSIYNTIIDVLRRCSKANLKNSQLKILVCSPLIDYPERTTNSIEDWGNEFVGIIKDIMNKEEKNIYIDIFHLPDTNISGVNPLKSFTEVLSNFISKEDAVSPEVKFKTIWKKTEEFIHDMKKMDKEAKSPFSVNRTIVSDIPFQILLYKSSDINEVVVSFAGKKILEDETLIEPYGFHSVDVDVVEAFENIFHSYIQEKRRNPIKPVHTLELIKRAAAIGKHQLGDYLKASKYDNIIERLDVAPKVIEVSENTFSPAFANSSKFTSIVIKSILGKKDKVLEIGAGSGVQSIIAFNTLIKLGNNSPIVYAAECDDISYKLLNRNLILNDLTLSEDKPFGINAIKAELYSQVTEYDYKAKANGYYKTIKSRKYVSPVENNLEKYCSLKKDYLTEITNGELYDITTNTAFSTTHKFSFLIADLPYVDTSTSNGLERAFFDPNHSAHKALFHFFSKSLIFENDARLITSFSSLGGEEDLFRFELMINECNLKIIQKQSYIESSYEWIVYTLCKNNDFDWWEYLNIKPDASNLTP